MIIIVSVKLSKKNMSRKKKYVQITTAEGSNLEQGDNYETRGGTNISHAQCS